MRIIRLHKLLDEWITERSHAEDGVGLSILERFIRRYVGRADKPEVRFMETEMFGNPEKRFKLPPALCQSNGSAT